MGKSISQETARRQEKHQEAVEGIDDEFVPYGFRFLLSLPDHRSILTNGRMNKGKMLGIKDAKTILKAIKDGMMSKETLLEYIGKEGQELLISVGT